ncbi:hypothetical protein [Simiduia aestuariiviva]|uniref:Uncharacterized protein n=1 Tax=Simiduia aestuariiviva TaxID=1510459 RepID=A0A839UXM5_9GAMM|nr:hypothetical protein [Simiduia aestuariiviva]MBB3170198.1 hypothetical protein [Simiduia aestuariiviva]
MNESDQAKQLLAQRESGISVSSGLASMKGRMIYRFIMILICIAFYYSTEGAPVFVLIIGFALGMYIQDYSWLQSIAKSWGFTKSVINWQEVERIAKKNS